MKEVIYTILKALAIAECVFLLLFILWMILCITFKTFDAMIPKEKQYAEEQETEYFSKGEEE